MAHALWRCYRCDLAFNDEAHAKMHAEISGHSPTKVRMVPA